MAEGQAKTEPRSRAVLAKGSTEVWMMACDGRALSATEMLGLENAT